MKRFVKLALDILLLGLPVLVRSLTPKKSYQEELPLVNRDKARRFSSR